MEILSLMNYALVDPTYSCPFSCSIPPKPWCSLAGPQQPVLLDFGPLGHLDSGLAWRPLAAGHNTVHSTLPRLHSGQLLPYLMQKNRIKKRVYSYFDGRQ